MGLALDLSGIPRWSCWAPCIGYPTLVSSGHPTLSTRLWFCEASQVGNSGSSPAWRTDRTDGFSRAPQTTEQLNPWQTPSEKKQTLHNSGMNTALDPPARPSPHLPMGPARCWRPRGDGGTEGPRDGQRADSEREGGRRGRPGFKAALRGPRPGRSRRRPQPRRCGRGAGRLRQGIRPRPGAARRGSEVEAVLCLLPGLSGRGFGDFVYLQQLRCC